MKKSRSKICILLLILVFANELTAYSLRLPNGSVTDSESKHLPGYYYRIVSSKNPDKLKEKLNDDKVEATSYEDAKTTEASKTTTNEQVTKDEMKMLAEIIETEEKIKTLKI